MNDELMAISGAFDDVLEASLPLEQLLEGAASDSTGTTGVRDALNDMGFQAIALPEELGGFGGRPDWIAALMQVAGTRLLPSALRDEALLLAPLLGAVPGDEQTAQWLSGLTEGTVVGAATAAIGGSPAGRVIAAGARIECEEIPILVPPGAQVVGLVTPEGGWIFDSEDPRVTLGSTESIDPGQGAHRLTIGVGPVPDERSIGSGAALRLLQNWQLGLLAEAVGCGDRVTTISAEYAVERRQFDRPIATFQAVAHLLADMRQRTELGRSVLARLVSLMEHEAEDEVADLLAAGALWIPQAAREVCETGIQVLGGMGFTWEMGLHLWYRRALQIQALLGGAHGAAAAAGAHFVARARSAAGTGGHRDD